MIESCMIVLEYLTKNIFFLLVPTVLKEREICAHSLFSNVFAKRILGVSINFWGVEMTVGLEVDLLLFIISRTLCSHYILVRE